MSRAAVFAFFALVYAVTMSGTIASSDGHTIFLLTRSIAERGALDVPGGNTLPGVGGQAYTKAGIGQALLGLPAYFVASRVVDAVPALEKKREAVQKFTIQSMAPLVGALVCLLFLGLLRAEGVPPRTALLGTLLLGLATPVWVYSKTYTAETWLMLCLLAAFASVVRFRRTGSVSSAALAGAACGLAVLIKVAMALPVVAFAVYFLFFLRDRKGGPAAFAAAAAPLLAAAAGILLYNHARFGSFMQSGYGVEQTSSAYGTPLLVGLYGLLFSSGKGVFLFAPPLLLLFALAGRYARAHRAEFVLAVGVVVPSLLLNARFRAWGGDGSWGPRYLVPFLPILMIPAATMLAESGRARRWAAALLTLGVLAQWGGVSIHFGSYLREAGEYPYQRAFEDPRFLEDTHWVPNFSPLAGHWRMFSRNFAEHLKGEWPRVTMGSADAAPENGAVRIALSGADKERLLHGIDFWFLYLMYVGAASSRILVLPAAMTLLAGWMLWRAWSAAPAGARAP